MSRYKRALGLISIVTALLVGIADQAAYAQTGTLKVSPASISHSTEGEVTIEYANTAAASAFQFEVNLPAGFSYVANSAALQTNRRADHEFSANVQSGKLTLIGYSVSGADLKGAAGALVKFRVKVPAQPGSHTLSLTNVEFSDKSGAKVTVSAESGNVTVLGPQLSTYGEVNFGSVPLGEQRQGYLYISNSGNQALTISGISTNDSRFALSTSFPLTLQSGSGQSVLVSFSSNLKGSIAKELTINSNSATDPVKVIGLKATAFAVNEMSVGNVTSRNLEEATVSVSVKNMEAFSAFEFRVPLTEEMEYVAGSAALSTRRDGHTVSASVKDRMLTIVAFSLYNKAFKLSEGEVVNFKLKTVGQGSFPLTLQGAEISDLSGDNVISATYNGSLTIQSPQINFSSADLDFGKVSVTGSGERSFTISNTGQADLVVTGMDLASTYFRHNLTFPFTIAPGGSRQVAFTFSGAPAGSHKITAKLYHSDKNRNPSNIQLQAISFEPNQLVIGNLSVLKGGVGQVNINLTNYSNVTGFQFDITLPDGVTANKSDFALSNRAQGHSINVGELTANKKFRILAFSMNSSAFSGKEGAVITFPVKVSSATPEGTYSLTITNAEVSDDKLKDVLSGVINGSILVHNLVLAKSSLSSPANGSESIALQPQLTWQSVTDATHYQLQLSTSPDFNNPAINVSGLTASVYNFNQELTKGVTYHWRVRGYNGSVEGAWSDAWRFTTQSVVTSIGAEITADVLQVYPNPSSGNVNLAISDAFSVDRVQIRDLRSRLLYEVSLSKTDKLVNLNLTGFSNGTYLLVFFEGGSPKGYRRIVKY
jgi:hypothetical protein